MEYKSIWQNNNERTTLNKLKDNLTVDVLIIGGGLTGMQTLYQLRNSNLKIALVEARKIGYDTSLNTTGKISYLQGTVYQELTKRYSLSVAHHYLESQLEAQNTLVDIIRKNKIACDLEKTPSYLVATNTKELKKVKKEKEILQKLGINVSEENITYNEDSAYALKVTDTYVFHPLKYLNALTNLCFKKQKNIYELTKIIKIVKKEQYYQCYTAKNYILAKKVILACHYPFFIFPYLFPFKTSVEKSYISASPFPNQHYSAITANKAPISIRFQKDNMLYLTKSSPICNNLNESKNYQELKKKVEELGLSPTNLWKNTDIITVDKLPYIGYITKNNPNLLIGTGYNTWGMTNSTLASLILKDLVLGNSNRFTNLCNPLRISMKDTFSLTKNLGYSLSGFLKSKISKNKDFYQNVIIKNINGKSIGIYQENGKTYQVYNKCPHLGCSLIFNAKEKTWDCPCHASRFTKEGKCIKGPSCYDISYKE